MDKTHEKMFPGANCEGNFRLLSDTFLRGNSLFAAVFMSFTQLF